MISISVGLALSFGYMINASAGARDPGPSLLDRIMGLSGNTSQPSAPPAQAQQQAQQQSQQQGSSGCEPMSFDCKNQQGTIGTFTFPIACGYGTGAGKASNGKLICHSDAHNRGPCDKPASGNPIHDSSGRLIPGLPKGTPELDSYPPVFPGGLFHVGITTKGHSSHGCVHVTQDAFDRMNQCAKSNAAYTIIPYMPLPPKRPTDTGGTR